MALSKRPKQKMFCRQGKTLRHSFYFQDEHGNYADLTGFTGKVDIRSVFPDGVDDSSASELLISLTTNNGGVAISEHGFTMHIDAVTTAGFPEGIYFYEPELYAPSGDVIDFIAPSIFQVLPEITL